MINENNVKFITPILRDSLKEIAFRFYVFPPTDWKTEEKSDINENEFLKLHSMQAFLPDPS